MPKPIDTLSVPAGKGAFINAAIWENEVEQDQQKYKTYSVSLEKRYHDGKTWQTAKSFQANELLQVAYLANEAYKRALRQRQESNHQHVA